MSEPLTPTDLILSDEEQQHILSVALASKGKASEEGIYYRYQGPKAERQFCKTMMAFNKLYTRNEIAQMSFRGVNGEFAKKGTHNYSIMKYRGGANCKHVWHKIEIKMDSDGLPYEIDRGVVDDTPVERLNYTREELNQFEFDMKTYEQLFDDMKTYELFFDDKCDGVYGISLVEKPAIEVDFFKFSKDEAPITKITFADSDKQIVTSPVLIPNQKIFRNTLGESGDEKGFVFVSADTISELQQNFFKNNYNHNSTLEHITPIEGLYFFESWIIEDPKNDKSTALGFSGLPKGTWMVSAKLSDDLWNDYIKTEKVKGLSIDAMLGVKETKLNKQENFNMNRQFINTLVADAIKKFKLASDLPKYATADGQEVYADALQVDSVVTDVDGNPIADKTIVIDGMEYKTDNQGIITEAKEVEKEVKVEIETEMADMPVEVPVETPAVDPAAEVTAENEQLKKEVESLQAEVDSLKVANADLEAKLSDTESAVVKMKSELPASEGIKDVPSKVELGKEIAKAGILDIVRKHSKQN